MAAGAEASSLVVFDDVEAAWSSASPAHLRGVLGSADDTCVPLVELFTSAEQRVRSTQGHSGSSIGARLRVRDVTVVRSASSTDTVVDQADPETGIETTTVLTVPDDIAAARIRTVVTNRGAKTTVLTAIASASLSFGSDEHALDGLDLITGRSEWLAEGRWVERPLRDELPRLSLAVHGQDGRGRFALTGRGSWSTGGPSPVGLLIRRADGRALAWQVESSAPWHVEVMQRITGGVLTLLGPTEREHGFAVSLAPDASFETVPAAIALADGGRDGAIAELTRYRRWARRPAAGPPTLVYNDFMNTLMGDPTAERLLPLIDAAADAGAGCFCVDAGWFADPAMGDWWDTVGEWREAAIRFPEGLDEIMRLIRARGMRCGLWLEPEAIGVRSSAAATLPEDAFFTRHGSRVRDHDRYLLDLRHPAARAHLDATVDRIVAAYGLTYLKLDANVDAGAGTSRNGETAAAGLLAHTRALHDWLRALRDRHPGVWIENCASGAMRADPAILALSDLQSTSDQQDPIRYPPIAASAPMSILPEQCASWAYPSVSMSIDETVFTLVTGLSGRPMLSGFLHELSEKQRMLVRRAAEVDGASRGSLATRAPVWPLGLPGWDDEVVVLGLAGEDDVLLYVWVRSAESRRLTLPVSGTGVVELFPGDPASPNDWSATLDDDVLRCTTSSGVGARVFRVVTSPAV